jgi:signal transduction histidine kinase
VLDENFQPIHWRNIADVTPEDTSAAVKARLKILADKMRAQNNQYELKFAENYVNYFCYGDSRVIEQLKLMPFIEIGIVVAFLIVALIGFQNIKRSEERHIWVGMAKETAHQLGTPISSLLGWLEMIEGDSGENAAPITAEEFKEAVNNMKMDVNRLQRVANRFGLIGSRPELRPYDLNHLINETVEYYRRRLPLEGQGKTISFVSGDLPMVALNAELLGWSLENLVKNALQAVDSKTGKVEVRSTFDSAKKAVNVEISDNGHGIPPGAMRKVFRPGFTTKKRGWGLGLTLVKRIIEEYHGGKVYLKRSRPGETIFEINLPAS